MKIERILSIVLLLLERKKVSSSEFAKMFEVTPRTIFRDIETITKAGIPITSSPGVNGGFSIMERYKFEKKIFTQAEILVLILGLNSIHSTVSSEEVLNAIAKVKSLISEDENRLVDKLIAIDPSPWFGSTHVKPPELGQIRTAIEEDRLITFEYLDPFEGMTPLELTIEPCRLVLKNSVWYMQGFCTEKGGFRMFKVSRISSLVTHHDTFRKRQIEDEVLDITEKEIIHLTLLFDQSLIPYMSEYCGENNIRFYEGANWIAKFPFIANDHGYTHLLSFGDKCECIEPEHVRSELTKRIEGIYKVYST
ncbi:helix-turn-helix transcriptional regulator [Paenibacillus taichungensis]|uniref:helix-turn-helix transcriptional regulator n=1 Tax=Paenibacillus taichungensis TaxID=484184 RepID=UPI00399FEC8B